MGKTIDILKKIIDEGLVLDETHFPELGLPDTSAMKRGKVRDNYFYSPEEMLIVTTDRVSAFDVNMKQGLPAKGYVLAEQMDHMFNFAANLDGLHTNNHLIERVTPIGFRTRRAEPGNIEWVFRRHLYGSGWRDVKDGSFGDKYGFEITPEMVVDGKVRNGCKLKRTICTPTTKAEEGHDESLTREAAIERYGKGPEAYAAAEERYTKLFDEAYGHLLERGIIIPDTKFEEGWIGNEPLIIDEMSTSDSSRFWPAETYNARLEAGQDQISMDKEYLRQWLIDSGFKNRGVDLPANVRLETMKGYLDALKKMKGTTNDVERGLEEYYEQISDGGPEMMLYRNLVDRNILRGYCAVVLAGSGSDLGTEKKEKNKLFETLQELRIPYASAVVSGHKDSDRLADTVRWANKYPGDVVFVDLTGLSNGKGTTTAGGLTSRHVAFCYSAKEDPTGNDIYSSINVPRGVPLAIYNGGINTGLGVGQVLGYSHRDIRDNVEKRKAKMRAEGIDQSMRFGSAWRPG